MRADKLSKLKSGLLAQQNTFVRQAQLNQSSVRASFRVAQLIASSGKPFTDGEFVKKCLNAVAEEVCPEKKDVFNAVSLSASTITRRIEEIGGNVYAQLQQKTKEFDFFSLALDESTDVQDTAQLLIFIRGVSANFEMCEELAALQSLKGTTTGEDIFGKVCQTMEELDLDWSKLASITTDGAPSMVGATRGLIGRMNREMEERGLTAPLQIHCLIHQQALCCKVLKWDSVMKVVVSCINFIRAKGLKHRQFQQFLSELESAHGDVLYYTEVRWLSRGRVLRRFYELLPEINAFLHSKDKTVPELIDPEWKWHLAFLTDVTEMLNSLNLQLQGQGKLICDMYSHIKAFEVKLALLLEQVKKHNFIHLPATQNLSAENPAVPFPAEKCVEALEMLKAEFGVRFRQLRVNAKEIRLFQNPFLADIDEAQPSYQFELAELQNCDVLKDAFKPNSLIDFYAALPNDTEGKGYVALTGKSLGTPALDEGCRSNLHFWSLLLDQWNGVTFFYNDIVHSSDSTRLFTDAAPSAGFGGFFQGEWFAGPWPLSFPNHATSSALHEIYPIACAFTMQVILLRSSAPVKGTSASGGAFDAIH
ncbi:general transcription factor II-I repeat domain-containing protein 2-like [Trematomus bernacchii]|uniref:general transcription factor II-I repeat domain-containing protein 2-like n=1 Tax=Trematomus bernacchii TaxID=40690 RepID=UPI00146DA186|nr:general transcription factor II-I repeat domain-containing protein 2-like [Trematomus bernacchii]